MKRMINVALPKGRLGEKAYSLFARAGYDCPELLEENRKLTFENESAGVRYFWVKPSDVAIYVERGAADIGVAGALAVEFDAQPQIVDRIGVAQRVFVADLLGVEQVEQRLIEGLHAQFAGTSHDVLDLGELALEDLIGDQR